MTRSILQHARLLMRQRRFGFASRLLESYRENYTGSFEFYLALGTSYLYLGYYGDAEKNYNAARNIKVNDTELLLGQAMIFLRQNKYQRAIEYYLNILDLDPKNETAQNALEFIRRNVKDFTDGDFSAIDALKENGRIERFYPPLGINPLIIRNCIAIGLVVGIVISLCIIFWPREKVRYKGERGDLSALQLTEGEKKNSVSEDLSAAAVHYILDTDAINASYEDAVMYYHMYRENPARVEINRLINSNAAPSIKQKALILKSYLKDDITFDRLSEKDNYSYAKVEGDHILYDGCFVAWTGSLSDCGSLDDGSWYCTLLVGYETGKHLEGSVRVIFRPENVSPVNTDRPIRILGVVSESGGKIILDGRSVYQPVSGKFDD